jgi:hypothetical protein
MTRRALILAVAVCGVAAQLRTAVAQLPAPTISPKLRYDVIDVKSKKLIHTVRGWSEERSDQPQEVTAVSVLEFPAGNTAEIRVRFTRDSPPRCLAWHSVVRDRSGAEVASGSEQVVADAYPFLAQPLPADTYPPLAPLGYVLARFGLGSVQRRASFHFLLMGTSLLQMDLWVDGRETVDVPAGTFDAYRVQMRVNPESVFPNLPGFLIPFVSFFIPTQSIWLTVQEPQILIKFTGQMGPPGSPQLLIQLARVEQP